MSAGTTSVNTVTLQRLAYSGSRIFLDTLFFCAYQFAKAGAGARGRLVIAVAAKRNLTVLFAVMSYATSVPFRAGS